jgi:hypothetical protein
LREESKRAKGSREREGLSSNNRAATANKGFQKLPPTKPTRRSDEEVDFNFDDSGKRKREKREKGKGNRIFQRMGK